MTAVAAPLATDRAALWSRLTKDRVWDLAVIGGGATGLGIALDAALRGHSVVLVESRDFAAGTSSRATKLVHGGVRYLAQGNVALVREALLERGRLLRNAPHLARPLPFVMPSYHWWDAPFYGTGLKLYDLMAGREGLAPTRLLTRGQALRLQRGVQPRGLVGGVEYWDGQFDDARLALALARTAAAQGALLLNHCEAAALTHDGGKVSGLICRDHETGREARLQARCVINATGVWVDAVRRQDGDATGQPAPSLVAPSQGVHLVVDRGFLPDDHAILVPRTADGRVLFAVPWLGKVILGTTDTPRTDLPPEPRPLAGEVDFILQEAGRYLARAPLPGDVRSCWVGMRPLVKAHDRSGQDTKALSREHTVLISASGLVTVTGGKWTTYRAMAQDVLDQCERAALLRAGKICQTADFPLLGAAGFDAKGASLAGEQGLLLFGSEAAAVQALPGADQELGGGLTQAMVRFAVRHEYARTVEDVLARRSRLLFLDARWATAMAPQVGAIVEEETGRDPQLGPFLQLAAQYLTGFPQST